MSISAGPFAQLSDIAENKITQQLKLHTTQMICM